MRILAAVNKTRSPALRQIPRRVRRARITMAVASYRSSARGKLEGVDGLGFRLMGIEILLFQDVCLLDSGRCGLMDPMSRKDLRLKRLRHCANQQKDAIIIPVWRPER